MQRKQTNFMCTIATGVSQAEYYFWKLNHLLDFKNYLVNFHEEMEIKVLVSNTENSGDTLLELLVLERKSF